MAFHTFQTILIPGITSFAITLVGTRFLEAYLYSAGIVAEDRNKGKAVKLASSGGLAVAFGIIIGILAYTFGGSFIFVPVLNNSDILAVALSIMLISMVGFLDDINVKSGRVASTDIMDIRQGLKQWQKPIFTLIGALPLMAINAGVSSVSIPFIGTLELGVLYPLLIIPLAVIFVSNAVNLLGGFDGLQPSMTLIAAIGFMLYFIVSGGSYVGLFLSALLAAAILAFLPFNLYKAKIIPGDSFTYAVGATLVAIMVMGQAEAFGIIIFMPWIIEFFLHMRRKFKVTDLGILQHDGTFRAPYGKKIYSLTHLVMNIKKVKEQEVTLYLSLLEMLFVILAFLLKFAGLL
jgi:UDP-N-acetylglucosamine--dolichyl-phosphate N-acetylglucosaminephosphotransferase